MPSAYSRLRHSALYYAQCSSNHYCTMHTSTAVGTINPRNRFPSYLKSLWELEERMAYSNKRRECMVSSPDLHSADIPRFGCCMYEPPIGCRPRQLTIRSRSNEAYVLHFWMCSNAKSTSSVHFAPGAATVAVESQVYRPRRCGQPACQS